MKPSEEQEINPYQAPLADIELPVDLPRPDTQTVSQFRSQIHALGAFWIFVGALAIWFGVMLLTSRGEMFFGLTHTFFGAINICLGTLWLGLGILTIRKKMWAVYAALILSYVAIAPGLLSLNICGLGVLLVVIFQAHRVIRWAKQMHANGIPLTARA